VGLIETVAHGRILENPQPNATVNCRPRGFDVNYTASLFINYSFMSSIVAIKDTVECITLVLERENIHFFNFLKNNTINPTAEESDEDTKTNNKGTANPTGLPIL